jgi:hypothetical protein
MFNNISQTYKEYFSEPLQQFAKAQKDKLRHIVEINLKPFENPASSSLIGRAMRWIDNKITSAYNLFERILIPQTRIADLQEKLMPADGSCLFHSVRAHLQSLQNTRSVQSHLAKLPGGSLPDSKALRLEAVEYLKANRNHPSVKTLLETSLAEYNDLAEFNNVTKANFKDTLEMYGWQIGTLFGNEKRKMMNEITKLKDSLSKGITEKEFNAQAKGLEKSYQNLLKTIKHPQDIETMKALDFQNSLKLQRKLNLDEYLEALKDEKFFGGRDALFALSQIYGIEFKVYKKNADGSYQSQYFTSADDRRLKLAPKAHLALVNENHYNILTTR